MPTLRNVSPLGDLEVPLVGRVLAHGETFDVDDDTAAVLLEQPANYELVTTKAAKATATTATEA